MNLRTSLMIAMAATWLCGEVWASEFRKGPYLQNVSDASITVMWESSESDPCTVLVLDPESPQTIPAEADDDSMYEVTVSGLASGRRYRYAVECGDERREGEFATAPAAGAPLTFVVFGDTRSNARPHERLVARVRSEVPDFILGTGDMVDDGGREPQWQEFFEIERALLAENVLFPAVGNHDRQGRGRTADNYRKYFAVPENSPDPERYYAFTYAGARFIVLDSNAYSFSLTDQTAWLESQLRASEIDPAIDHVFVAMHHPPFSNSLHGGQRELRERWTPLFEQYGVTAVFSGHDHVYSRAEHGGVRYFVSGGGGAPLYPRSRRPSPIDRKAVKYFERVSHYLRVHIIGTYVEISAIRADGSLIEAVSWGQPSKKQDNDPAGLRLGGAGLATIGRT
ncbi:MAG: metallophosphoesterase, partial [Myxococcota bacterium]